MITFGYKKHFESIARAMIAIGLGICLFIFEGQAVEVLIKIIGIAILFAGVISIAPMLGKKKQNVKENKLGTIIGWTTCGIAAVIGLLLVLKPVWFAKIFIFVLAAAIIVFCVIQLMALISTLQYIDAAPLPLVLRGAALIGGIVVMFFSAGQVICYILGVLLVIYGVSELLAMPKIKKAEEIYIIKYGPAKDAKETEETKKEPSGLLVTGVKDAEYEEVK